MPPLHACAIYVSSGASAVAARVAAAAARTSVAVVDVFTDTAYARSSVKLVGEGTPLLESAAAAASEALRQVDLREEPHPAPHPRCGAVDMVAFMPLSTARAERLADELAACDVLAHELGARLAHEGCPVLLYGARAGRTLLEARRRTSFFASTRAASVREVSLVDGCAADLGPASVPQRHGVSVVGSMPYVTNFNVQVHEASLAQCKAAERAVRSELGVQVMALPHADGAIEIGCNLQASQTRDSPAEAAVLDVIAAALPSSARVGRAYVIGLTPSDALGRAGGGPPQDHGDDEPAAPAGAAPPLGPRGSCVSA